MVEIRTNTEVTEISALDDCGVYFIEAVDLSAGGNVEIFAEVQHWQIQQFFKQFVRSERASEV